MQLDHTKLEPSWRLALSSEFSKDYMKQLRQFLNSEKKSGATIYPNSANYFAAFDLTPLNKVKIVILGQDPYHGENQAHGLCFSVLPGVAVPPSLNNIYKELQSDLNIPRIKHGDLSPWAKQGVLLLNATLSVRAGEPGSHQKKGWEVFTDKIMEHLNLHTKNLVFMLWGSYAQKKGSLIDRKNHFVLEAPHPSPLSAHRGFLGCRHFSQANKYLMSVNKTPVEWQLQSKLVEQSMSHKILAKEST